MCQLNNLQDRLDKETDAVDGLAKNNTDLNKDMTELNGQVNDLKAKVYQLCC